VTGGAAGQIKGFGDFPPVQGVVIDKLTSVVGGNFVAMKLNQSKREGSMAVLEACKGPCMGFVA
jgi:hypothetical protein